MTSKKANATDQYVGNRVRTRRLMVKMNQTELSRKLGLSWQTVQKYETGEIRIGASRLQQISRILRVSPAFFFEDSPNLAQASKGRAALAPDYVTKFLASRDGVALADAFGRVKNIKLRRLLVRLVIEMLAKM
jgi:transcriptional regulator with XRE-family HTH domain